MFRIVYRKEAAKILLKMSSNTANLIREKLDLLAKNPFDNNPNIKQLKGVKAFRLRVGDWRIIYEVRNQELIILVLRIGAHGGIYK